MNPEKIYLDNTNLMYALGSNVNEGNLRETFFFRDISRTVTAWVVVTVTPARWYLIVTAVVLAAITAVSYTHLFGG